MHLGDMNILSVTLTKMWVLIQDLWGGAWDAAFNKLPSDTLVAGGEDPALKGQFLILPRCYRWGNRGFERWSHLPKALQLLDGRATLSERESDARTELSPPQRFRFTRSGMGPKNTQVMLLLLVWGPHLENHSCTSFLGILALDDFPFPQQGKDWDMWPELSRLTNPLDLNKIKSPEKDRKCLVSGVPSRYRFKLCVTHSELSAHTCQNGHHQKIYK